MSYTFHMRKPFYAALLHLQTNNCEKLPHGAYLPEQPEHLSRQVSLTRALLQLFAKITNNNGGQLH
jgi:hypothetical protein